jgi:hypothetical protein
MEIELDLKLGTGVEIDKDGSLAFKAVGFRARKKALLEAAKSEAEMKYINAHIDKLDLTVGLHSMAFKQSTLLARQGMLFEGF